MQKARQKINNFLRSQDQLCQGNVNITYSDGDRDGFGTKTGGICSLITTLFFTVFIIIQLYTWNF